MSKNKNLKITGAKKLDKVLPPRAEFVFQLDYHNEEITCQTLVNYGKQKFVLGETTSDDSIRDFEEEKMQWICCKPTSTKIMIIISYL